MKRRRYKVVVLNGDALPEPARPRRSRQRAAGWWFGWSWRLKLASVCYGAGALILLVRFV
jgi:hypothetical protein